MIDRRSFLAAAAVVGAGGLAGCGDGSSTGPVRVEMTDELNFEPKAVTVDAGTTVEWVTVGSAAHSVTAYEDDLPGGAAYFASGGFADEGTARSSYPDGSVGTDESYEHTFEVAGEYPYFCVPHERGMQGTVTVE